jgi:hypothetical protein
MCLENAEYNPGGTVILEVIVQQDTGLNSGRRCFKVLGGEVLICDSAWITQLWRGAVCGNFALIKLRSA